MSNNPLGKVDPDGRYEMDVHKWLTEALAIASGFSPAVAIRVGAADQGIDDSTATGPFINPTARRDYHFTTLKRREELWAIFEGSSSPEDLGVFFHASQDSYSHAEYSYQVGHANTHAPDKTFLNPNRADRMAADTYRRLLAAGDTMGVNLKALSWDRVEPYVARFNRATELRDKRRILDELIRYAKDVAQPR